MGDTVSITLLRLKPEEGLVISLPGLLWGRDASVCIVIVGGQQTIGKLVFELA